MIKVGLALCAGPEKGGGGVGCWMRDEMEGEKGRRMVMLMEEKRVVWK